MMRAKSNKRSPVGSSDLVRHRANLAVAHQTVVGKLEKRRLARRCEYLSGQLKQAIHLRLASGSNHATSEIESHSVSGTSLSEHLPSLPIPEQSCKVIASWHRQSARSVYRLFVSPIWKKPNFLKLRFFLRDLVLWALCIELSN